MRVATLAAMAFVGSLGLSGAAAAGAGEIGERIFNGGFEINDGGINAAGWTWATPVDLSSDIGFTSAPVYGGGDGWSLLVGSDTPVEIRQTIDTVVGESYEFFYAVFSDGLIPNTFESWFGGQVAQSVSDILYGDDGWHVFTRAFIASTPTTVVRFVMSNANPDSGYLQLDAVSVIGSGPSPVMEPGTPALIGLGLVLGAAWSRRGV